MRKRLVFITANANGGIGIIEWAVIGNISMLTFDPVDAFHTAMKHHKRWDEVLDQPNDDLIYVFYPDGNPGLIRFTEIIDNQPGKPFRLSRVTEFQTVCGMMPAHTL